MKYITLLCFTLSMHVFSLAQRHEFGLQAGIMSMVGDVGNTDGLQSVQSSQITMGLYYKKNFDGFLSARLSFIAGSVSGNDLESNNAWRRERGLSFHTTIQEFSVIGEYNFLPYNPRSYRNKLYHSPYLFVGIGVFGYRPTAELNGVEYNLRDLGTEGQLNTDEGAYGTTALSIPFGMGYKFSLSDRWRITLEHGWRTTNTDYLDDAGGNYATEAALLNTGGDAAVAFGDPTGVGFAGSKRAESKNRDWYYLTTLSISFNLYYSRMKCERN